MPSIALRGSRHWIPAVTGLLLGAGLLYWAPWSPLEPPTGLLASENGAAVKHPTSTATGDAMAASAQALPGSSAAPPASRGPDPVQQQWSDARRALSSNETYATYVRLSSQPDAGSQAAARAMLNTCRSALFNTFSSPDQKTYDNPFQMRAPAPLAGEAPTLAAQRRQAWDLVQLRCRPMFDNPSWEKMLQSPQRTEGAQDLASRKEALRLDVTEAVHASDIVTLTQLMHASSQAHPFFDGQLLGGLPTAGLFNEALDRVWASLTMSPEAMQDHVLSLSHCVQFGRCGQASADLPLVRKAAQTPEQQAQVQALAQRMQEALQQGRVEAFLRCNLTPCPAR